MTEHRDPEVIRAAICLHGAEIQKDIQADDPSPETRAANVRKLEELYRELDAALVAQAELRV